MRVRRSRQFAKVLSIYERCFGLAAKNLEIFLDHTFVRQSLINHVNISDSIANMVGRGFRLVTSSCVVAECQALGSLFFGALKILEGFYLLKCRHEYNSALGAAWCIRKRIRTARRRSKTFRRLKEGEKCFLFALASNDAELQALARTVPGMPVMFIAQRCINIEPIPETTQAIIDNLTLQSLAVNEGELARLQQIEEKFGLGKDDYVKNRKKKRGPSGPNPLSCRKKRPAAMVTALNITSEGKPRRQRKKHHRALRKTWAMRQVLKLYGTPSVNAQPTLLSLSSPLSPGTITNV
ncbi:rRNA-processing protein UTP23 -like protein [Echinococcus granulosus]|uniref:rRNA-processing protein utp23 n=1 Tax=Echinococcus granulosus TaxID=6210 RepID=U6J7F0_ECHGR|nr:rRNA-processing protein UTP23 [Echinococcus granulosus]EUB62047.1 rRNA-processing protein UTP23 [Echinococcus granulosus]KAH9284577.1 rRNA-processing protein UTP23 -like protein [Echinococcus granulosus]CDS19935.1 rRNA processing protein UTP23 [Echinococcus granulosus]